MNEVVGIPVGLKMRDVRNTSYVVPEMNLSGLWMLTLRRRAAFQITLRQSEARTILSVSVLMQAARFVIRRPPFLCTPVQIHVNLSDSQMWSPHGRKRTLLTRR